MEVLSLSTGTYDLTKKRSDYEEAGVREYWIVDPDGESVEVLELEEGTYQSSARVQDGGPIGSTLLPGFEIDSAALFATPGIEGGKSMSELDRLRTYRDQILTIAGRYGATDVRVFGAVTGRMAYFNSLLGG